MLPVSITLTGSVGWQPKSTRFISSRLRERFRLLRPVALGQ
jgi:hypothetical protein